MSYHDYRCSQVLYGDDYPFYGLIMAAMRGADDVNTAKLKAAWPDVYEELYARYHAPGGLLTGETIQEGIVA